MMAPEMRCDLTCLMTITDVLLFWLLLLLLLLATGITPPEHPYFACAQSDDLNGSKLTRASGSQVSNVTRILREKESNNRVPVRH